MPIVPRARASSKQQCPAPKRRRILHLDMLFAKQCRSDALRRTLRNACVMRPEINGRLTMFSDDVSDTGWRYCGDITLCAARHPAALASGAPDGLGWLLPSEAFAQANYCDVLWCLPYNVPASSGGKIDLSPLESYAVEHERHTYSYGVKGANTAAIATIATPAVSLSNTASFGLFGPLFPIRYYLHSAEYSNSAALVTSPNGHLNGPAVFLSSIGRPVTTAAMAAMAPQRRAPSTPSTVPAASWQWRRRRRAPARFDPDERRPRHGHSCPVDR